MMKVSSPFITPKAPEILYRNDLYKLVKAMIKDYKSVLTIYREKENQVALDAEGSWLTTDVMSRMDKLGAKWGKRFEEFAQTHSKKFVQKMLKLSNTQLKSMLKNWFSDERLELLGETIPVDLRQVVNANAAYNVSLISSIPIQYHDRIFGSLMRSITGGGSLKQLTIELNRYGVKSMKRAKLIAADQTNKVYQSITMFNCKRLGIQKMQWLHSHSDKDPRPLHIRKWDGKSSPDDPNGLDGLIFDLDKPPLIQKAQGNLKAIHGYPKQLFGCSCLMRAVLE